MNIPLRKLLVACALAGAAGTATAQITLYEHDDFRGRAVTADRPIVNLDRIQFNDKASSVSIRGGWWDLCEDAGFSGRCITLGPGNYPSLGSMGMNDKVSSVREADPRHVHGRNYEPGRADVYDPRAYDRSGERYYDRDRGQWREVPNSRYEQQ